MTASNPDSPAPRQMRGYIEGYYGRLLDWQDRRRIVDRLADLGMTAYLYAPKEDSFHRVAWRTAWPEDWLHGFAAFCDHARDRQVDVIAGIAPGLDYAPRDDDRDFARLAEKTASLVRAGAAGVALMFDDIEPVSEDSDTVTAEMAFHGGIATRLAACSEVPILFVPRIYADEISILAASAYATLDGALPADMPVFHCGSHIVTGADPLSDANTAAATGFRQRLIFWDNFFCNDYCPRRLFLGPHTGRSQVAEMMLNGTGMIETDLLLLDVMAAGEDQQAWRTALAENGVPDEIHDLAAWFGAPVMANDTSGTHPEATSATFDAIERLLWRWKTPLAREWYPFIFGLKHDLQMASGELPSLRVTKTQTPALSELLSPLTGKEPHQ